MNKSPEFQTMTEIAKEFFDKLPIVEADEQLPVIPPEWDRPLASGKIKNADGSIRERTRDLNTDPITPVGETER